MYYNYYYIQFLIVLIRSSMDKIVYNLSTTMLEDERTTIFVIETFWVHAWDQGPNFVRESDGDVQRYIWLV